MLNKAPGQRQGIGRLFSPKSIAIVGASPTAGSFGASILSNLERAEYAGELFLVNPKRSEVAGRPCVGSVDDLPESVDCAVLAIPRASVVEAVLACERRKVGSVIIFSAGFAETGAEGLAEQQQIKEIAQRSGMIIEGPNCIGMVNYIDAVPLTFVATDVERTAGSKRIAIVSQSGAMAAVLGVSLRSRQLNISLSVSTGNEAANGVEDFIEYMIEEPHTHVIAMIVEQFRNPNRFLTLVQSARKAGKFLVLLHPGSSSRARISAQSHTGAMAGDYGVMKTKVEHAGVLMVDTLEELIDVADILMRCKSLPTAGGAAVFTESGAFKALTLDLCETIGLALPPMGDRTVTALGEQLPDFILPTNPLDITAHGLIDTDLYRRTLPIVLADPSYGSVILAIILTDKGTSGLKLPPILEAIREIDPTKPVLFAGVDEGAEIDGQYVEQLRELGVPFFPSPERAFRAMARVTAFAKRLAQTNVIRTRSFTDITLASGTIPEHKAKQVLKQIGIPVPAGELATSVAEAQRIAAEIGYPVVLKAQASALCHKSDVGGVALNLKNDDELVGAWQKMQEALRRSLPELVLDGVLVEAMSERGAEIIVGARNNPDWGPVLLIGFGGFIAEALNDVRLIVPGLPEELIREELRLLKSAALLHGFRGSQALDVPAIAGIVARLGDLVLDQPSIQEVDINPVVVYPSGAVALDALIITSKT